jgi:hypothetical protein
MAIAAMSEITKRGDEKETKQARARRTRPLPSMARKISELALELEQIARLENERDRKDDGRVRSILLAASGNAIEAMLRNMNLSQTDKEFLIQHGWRL